jgi:preprotein translocase subunit SecD
MKSLFLTMLILFSVSSYACSIHKLFFKVEDKILYKTNTFHIHSLKKENDKWMLNLKLTNKVVKRINEVTSKNVGKNLEILFDKEILSNAKIESDLKIVNGEFLIASNFTDAYADSIQKDCQSK